MRLAATIRPVRGAVRRAIDLPGTLRAGADRPSDIVIVDISASGFLAELPAGSAYGPGARVRVAAVEIGRRDAVVVRREGRLFGFIFTQPLPPGMIDALGPYVPNVEPLFAAARTADDQPRRLSPRLSLALMVAIAGGLWLVLALALYATA